MNDGMTTTIPDVELKAVRNATISVDKAEGIVEAFAAAVGNKDSVGDIITPGAFSKSLHRRKPRVVWGHNWNEPIGKVLEINEVTSADPRLPSKMKEAGVGGLFVKVQFNLNSERGREAFASVMFFGEDQEWSIGYKTIVSDYDPVRSAKLLKEVELYEVSPVLHGANNLTGTISVKSDEVSDTPNDMSACEFTYSPTKEDDSFSFSLDGKEYFNGHGYEDDDESDDRRMVRKAFQTALGELEDLKFVERDKVVFTRPGDGMWMSKYRRHGRRIEMTRPVRARSQLVYMPVEMSPAGPQMPSDNPIRREGHGMMSCPKCGYRPEERKDDEKSGEPDDIETKAGRVISNSNMGKLRQASELLNQVVSAGMPPAPKPTMEDEAEEKKALNGKVVHISEKGDKSVTEGAEEFIEGINELSNKHGWEYRAPEGMAGKRLTHAVDIYLSTDDNMSEQMSELAETIEEAKCDLTVSVERKDIQ